MRFETQLKRIDEAGFRTFESVKYFLFFAKNEGKSVRELTHGDINEYQKALRYFKLMSDGTKREPGLGLMEIEQIEKPRKKGRYKKINAIKLTPKGRKLYQALHPTKRIIKRKKTTSEVNESGEQREAA